MEKINNKEDKVIVYSADNNYIRHCAASLVSLFENNMDIDALRVIVLSNNIDESSKKKIKTIGRNYNRDILFIELENICDKFEKNNEFPISAFGRLFLQNIENLDKVLYIDCDTIINGSLKELFEINIDEYYLAGVQDTIQHYAITVLGMKKYDRYLNSGVLLINLKKWREDNLKTKFIECIKSYDGNVPHNDQGVLNIVCNKKILFISPKYNFMPEFITMTSKQLKKLYLMKNFYTEDELNDAKKDIRIIHYLTKFYNRPWFKTCTHPMKEKYLYYLEKTDFQKDLLNGELSKKIKLQKNIYEKMPFAIFVFIQRIFDIRRKFNCYRKHK